MSQAELTENKPARETITFRPCPRCGSERIRGREVFFRYWIECADCGLRTRNFCGKPQAAIDAWNNAPVRAQLNKEK